ncbi:MAG: hypothetical protein ACLTSX_06695 [Collinsella sp.]
MDGEATGASLETGISVSSEIFGVSTFADRFPTQLSGGQQRRVAARHASLAARPGILMPERGRSRRWTHISRARSSKTCSDVFSVVDRTWCLCVKSRYSTRRCRLSRVRIMRVMHNGCVEESGTAGELIARPQTLAGMEAHGVQNVSAVAQQGV